MARVPTELDLAWQALERGRYAEAAQKAGAILLRFPDNVSALACHAMASWKNGGDVAAALAEIRRAASLAPGVASVRHNLATLLASSGEIDAAAEQFEAALTIKPDDVQAFYGLSQNFRFREETELLRAMLALHADPGLPSASRAFLSFGLAKAYDDLGQAERAMGFANEANGLVGRPFNLAGENRALEDLKRMTAADAFRQILPAHQSSHAPLFIVGMNRSGTTLVETILSRHPEVSPQGETMEIPRAEQALEHHPDVSRHAALAGVSRDWLTARAKTIINSIAAKASGPFSIFTDKLPENAVRLGLIAKLFPHARIVYVRRHPLDAGVSNYFQRYSTGQGFSARQDWIGVRTRQIADAMGLWKQSLDLPILDVNYELLVSDPEGQTRRLVAFAGLAWNDACLSPENAKGSVRTASQFQVRQKINTRSVARWKAYESWLGPMIAAMGGHEWIEAEIADAVRAGAKPAT